MPSATYRAQVLTKSPALKPILDAYQTGSAATSDPNVSTSFGSGNQLLNGDSGLFRIDHRLNDRYSLFLRYSQDSESANVPVGGNGFLRDKVATDIKPYNAILSFQQLLSPRLIHETKGVLTGLTS